MTGNAIRRSDPLKGEHAWFSCGDLDAALGFFVGRLGFRLDAIYPADEPRVAELSGSGLRLRLERSAPGRPHLVRDEAEGFTLMRAGELDAWNAGRAGMLYRDLVPDRRGGSLIASHIRIPDAGPVPDYVHHHAVQFQFIFCRRGWVRVVYEDQGAPFVLRAGDCVLQPPHIRHRVLESSAGLEVVELGAPSEHVTRVEHELELPSAQQRPAREFDGQRFVRHVAAEARWSPWWAPGFECRDSGIHEATRGLASVRVARVREPGAKATVRHEQESAFYFVLAGAARLHRDGAGSERVARDYAFLVPAGLGHAFDDPTEEFELLEVTLGAELRNGPACSR